MENSHGRLVANDRKPHRPRKGGLSKPKPLQILERIIRVHSMPGDSVLDFFAGSGTTREAGAKNDRCSPSWTQTLKR
ncbi:MAG: hypothetical protein H0W86_06285 [Armatimonadetes bacterium]|nr:hypothetical protein [Armatimonadota bacterium]